MEKSNSETDSLRVEHGERAEDDHSDVRAETPMLLGSMIRGPIGHEAAAEQEDTGSNEDVDREEAERRSSTGRREHTGQG